MTNEKFLTVGELATLLRVSKHTVYKWIQKRKIPYIRIGNIVRFDMDDIKKNHKKDVKTNEDRKTQG